MCSRPAALLDCEYDLILEHKGLYSAQHPPEQHSNGQVLDPGELEQLPESWGVCDGEGRVV